MTKPTFTVQDVFLMVLLVGVITIVIGLFSREIYYSKYIVITQEQADYLCQKLTNTTSVTAFETNHKFFCNQTYKGVLRFPEYNTVITRRCFQDGIEVGCR